VGNIGANSIRILMFSAALALLVGCAESTSPPIGTGGNATTLWRATAVPAIGPLALGDSSVYFVDAGGTVHALDRRTGLQRWQLVLPGAGSTWGVEFASGRLFVAVGPLVAIDAKAGIEQWRVVTQEGAGTLMFSADDSLVYPTTYRGLGDAVAYGASDGRERWRVSTLPRDSVAQPADQVRVFEPVASGGSVASSFVWWKGNSQPKGGLAIFDARSGLRRWSTMLPAENAAVSTFPSRAAVGAGVVVATTLEGLVYAYDEATGSALWTGSRVKLVGSDTLIPSTSDSRPIAVAGQVALVGSGRGYVAAHDVRSGVLRWSRDVDVGAVVDIVPVGSSSALTTHLGGELTLLDLSTGAVKWQYLPRSDADRVYAVRLSGDTVFASSRGGMWAFKLP
jgi:outer membrane protein assembly factor BamB